MRTTLDRLRHAVLFEILGIILTLPIGYFLFHLTVSKMGAISVVSSITATAWNYIYNLLFDKSMLRLRGSTTKTLPIRLIHALLFELGLIVILLPAIAAYLNITLWEAFLMDIVLVVFYLIYAFGYNWIYDRVFPIPPLVSVPAE